MIVRIMDDRKYVFLGNLEDVKEGMLVDLIIMIQGQMQ